MIAKSDRRKSAWILSLLWNCHTGNADGDFLHEGVRLRIQISTKWQLLLRPARATRQLRFRISCLVLQSVRTAEWTAAFHVYTHKRDGDEGFVSSTVFKRFLTRASSTLHKFIMITFVKYLFREEALFVMKYLLLVWSFSIFSSSVANGISEPR